MVIMKRDISAVDHPRRTVPSVAERSVCETRPVFVSHACRSDEWIGIADDREARSRIAFSWVSRGQASVSTYSTSRKNGGRLFRISGREGVLLTPRAGVNSPVVSLEKRRHADR